MSEKKLPVIPEDRQSQLKLLIARGKEQGYLTYAEVNDHLPPEIVDPEQIEDIVNTINDMNQQIADAADEQHHTAEEVSRNVAAIHTLSERVANNAKAAVADSEDLEQQSRALRREMDHFEL